MVMDRYERFVCGWFLSEYDHESSYDEIQQKLNDDDNDEVIVWQPFENLCVEDLVTLMDDMVEALKDEFAEEED